MPSLGDAHPYMKTVHDSDYKRTVDSYRYIIARRDSLIDRIRFGLIALNGASLVALLSAIAGGGKGAAWIGIDQSKAPLVAACFAAGALLAGFSAIRQEYVSTMEAADAFTRLMALQHALSLYGKPDEAIAREKLDEAVQAVHKAPLIDFQFSIAAGVAQSFSGAAWLLGVTLPLSSLFYAVPSWWPF